MTPPTTTPQSTITDPFQAIAQQLTPKQAISYIRVSTREQAQRGGTQEGFSIPAQREANKKKAASIGALICKEFVDRGESARSANRPQLQQMLRYIQTHPNIDYCIVHKLDRLARNRADDVDINRALEKANIRLISTTENIDQTPGGILLHGIMSSIAEFYSRNLANEVIKGMQEKVRNGGTPTLAPIGYLNKRKIDDQGRDIAWVDIDPVRGPLIQQVFEEYATGKWTLQKLAERMQTQGLMTRPTPTRPAKPLSRNRILDLLTNPYYQGIVTYQGVEYPGKHQALVTPRTWQSVQTFLKDHRNGERQRVHRHPLKSIIRCGKCHSRLIVQMTTARNGNLYPYFICCNRHRTKQCSFKAVLITEVDQKVADIYKALFISETNRNQIEAYLHNELEKIYASQITYTKNLETNLQKLKDEQLKILQAHYADAIPLTLLKTEQARIQQ